MFRKQAQQWVEDGNLKQAKYIKKVQIEVTKA